MDDLDEALKCYQQAHEIFVALDAVEDATYGHKEFADVYRTSGNPDKARVALRHYAEAAQAANDTDSYIDALLGLAEVETEAGEYEQAVSQAFWPSRKASTTNRRIHGQPLH
jgi:tetratricopeptide (TPR) repeat protein